MREDKPDQVNATFDFAFPVDEQVAATGVDRIMLSVGTHSVDAFMIDGGSTCHVLGFVSEAIRASLHNERSVDLGRYGFFFSSHGPACYLAPLLFRGAM